MYKKICTLEKIVQYVYAYILTILKIVTAFVDNTLDFEFWTIS